MPLRVWLSVFCPVYRGTLASLAGLNLISAVGVFVELQLLRLLTVALSGPAAPPSATCSIREWAASGFALSLQPCGASLPMFLLLIYAASILLQSGVDMFALTVNSRLMQRARRDAERELLGNLLARMMRSSFDVRPPRSSAGSAATSTASASGDRISPKASPRCFRSSPRCWCLSVRAG